MTQNNNKKSNKRYQQFFFFILIVLLIIAFLGSAKCKTGQDTNETTTTTISSVTTTTIGNSTNTERRITDEEFADAETLIQRAKLADAQKYASDELEKSENFLKDAKSKNDSDSKAARGFLEESKKYANKAYYKAYEKKSIEAKKRCDILFDEVKSIGGDKQNKEDYDYAKKLYSEGDDSFDQKDFVTSLMKYEDTEKSLQDIIDKVALSRKEHEDKINYTKGLIKKAKEMGAEKYSKDNYDNANKYLGLGIKDYSDLKYKESDKDLDNSQEYALKAIEETTLALKELKRKEALEAILNAGKTIEDASKTEIINENGEKEKGDEYKFKFDESEDSNNLNNSPDDNISSYKELLAKAIEYINKAKEAYKSQDYDLAIEYAKIAKRIADKYKGEGIKTKYTVRLIPQRRDCLWRISEYKNIYNDPFLWPRIWKANKKIIFNPDLIFPGQVLAIPDMD